MGFLRQQEERVALRLLAWHYQHRQIPLPPADELRQRAAVLVTDAHRIARERGSNVLTILRQLIAEIVR
jgi:hypothetical protein